MTSDFLRADGVGGDVGHDLASSPTDRRAV